MKLDPTKFFDNWREKFGPLMPGQVIGCNALLAAIEADQADAPIEWLAYELATIYHETARTMLPIEEIGKGHGRPYGQPDPVTGQTYYGRGLVQLTWKGNYQKFSDLLGLDLVTEPSLALRPDIAYAILKIGMTKGMFTGKKLEDFINPPLVDYFHARRIINALDRAETIADYADAFEDILKAAVQE